MKRTTLTLTDDIAFALEREARRRRLPASQIAREALAAHLGVATAAPRKLHFAALGSSGDTTTGRNFEEEFDAEWDRDQDRDR